MERANWRAAGVAITLIALLAVIALASREPLRGTVGPATGSSAPVTPLLIVVLGGGALMVGAVVSAVWTRPRRRKDDEEFPLHELSPIEVHWAVKLGMILLPIAVGAALVAAAIVGTRRVSDHGLSSGAPEPLTPTPVARPHANHPAESFAVPGWLPWTLVGIVVAAACLTAIALFWRAQRERRAASGADEAASARATVEAAMDALREPTDPRRAVIAAYARMEHDLAGRDLGRHRPEAPREYLDRVLRARNLPVGPVTTLTALFEEARFSRHQIPDSMPRRALRALDDIRTALSDAR